MCKEISLMLSCHCINMQWNILSHVIYTYQFIAFEYYISVSFYWRKYTIKATNTTRCSCNVKYAAPLPITHAWLCCKSNVVPLYDTNRVFNPLLYLNKLSNKEFNDLRTHILLPNISNDNFKGSPNKQGHATMAPIHCRGSRSTWVMD